MNSYLIEIRSNNPPRVFLHDKLAGGEVVSITCNDPDLVSAKWLAEHTGLSKTTITNKLKDIAQGSGGKHMYHRETAITLLNSKTTTKGRPRKE